jgi:hypothetical protein
MKNFVQRLKEPSTWAGLAALSVLFGADPHKVAALGQVATAIVPFVPVDGGVLAQAVGGIAAAAAVLLPESKPAPQAKAGQ